ncbi:MAG TPA: prepilin-type N-terminal cleavage/methylation domain-containing protein [Candidatus Acidoferrales bacterium]
MVKALKHACRVKMKDQAIREAHVRHKTERGATLIELMIAMLVLAIGLAGVTTLLVTAIASNNRNNTDTTATLLAQMVTEQISAQDVYNNGLINVTDCTGTIHQIDPAPGAVGTGNGAKLKANGTIDFTQDPTALIAAFEAMNYVDCSAAGGVQTTYDVRWNVMSASKNPTIRMITAAARPLSSSVKQFGGLYFAIPANIRSIGAPGAQ